MAFRRFFNPNKNLSDAKIAKGVLCPFSLSQPCPEHVSGLAYYHINKMLRRQFFGAIASLFPLSATPLGMFSGLGTDLIRPSRLREGATVALIATSSPPSAAKLEKALANLNGFGHRVVEGKSLRARHGYLAGTDSERLADLHWAFQDPEIEAVWCVRGGYGAARLLPLLDFDLIGRNPKPLIGYSDVTALHIAIHQRTGLVTFHGPVAAADYPEDTLHHFRSVLVSPAVPHRIEAPDPASVAEEPERQPFTIAGGKATGTLTGGNISILASLAGTPFSPVFTDKIVFLEDVGEQPYRLDRLLTQLLQGTDLAKAAGIALGVFLECEPKPDTPSFTLSESLKFRLGALGIPVFYGIPLGHVSHQATFPYGIQAALDADKMTIELLETAVR